MPEALDLWEPVAQAFGLPVTVQLAGEEAVPAVGVWMAPTTDTTPALSDGIVGREAVHVMALSRAEVPKCPRGTVIHAAWLGEAEACDWIVDGVERVDADHVRYYLKKAPPAES